MGAGFKVSDRNLRAGAQALSMATDPVKRQILETLMGRTIEMRPGRIYQVSPPGREALFSAAVADRWLASAPQGALDFDSEEGEAATAALIDGWTSTIVHALARGPLTLEELDGAVDDLDRDEVERRLEAMREADQIETLAGGAGGGEEIHMLTDWLREGIAPLVAAGRLERRTEMAGAAPIEPIDVEAAFRLALPLIELPRELTGSCRLGTNLREEDEALAEGPPDRLIGVTAQVELGRVISVESGLDSAADASAAGSASDWLDAVIDRDASLLRFGGDRWLTAAVLKAMHEALFGG